jgi:hypothetical protein
MPLIGNWLGGFGQDISGYGLHGQMTGDAGPASRVITIPHSPALSLGSSPFTIAAKVRRAPGNIRELGSIISKFDRNAATGFNLNLFAAAPGYCGSGSDAMVFGGINSGESGTWQSLGRPSPGVTYVNGLTAFNGELYCGVNATATAPAAVCRYLGGGEWVRDGEIGAGSDQAVLSLVVHQGALYALTSIHNWMILENPCLAEAALFRREANGTWTNLGAPFSGAKRMWSLASYGDKLYCITQRPNNVDSDLHSYANGEWTSVAALTGTKLLGMGRSQGKLLIGSMPYGVLYNFDGATLTPLGNPYDVVRNNQTHVATPYDGVPVFGVWESGLCGYYGDISDGASFINLGAVSGATEINAMLEYNGKLYAGSLPNGEVSRHDGNGVWTKDTRFNDAGYGYIAPDVAGVAGEMRLTSLGIFNGKLVASTGSRQGHYTDCIPDSRGTVWAMEAGQAVSDSHDIGYGDTTVVLRRSATSLDLFLNGVLVQSRVILSALDISNTQPLCIGAGNSGPLDGYVLGAKLWNEAISNADIAGAFALAKS